MEGDGELWLATAIACCAKVSLVGMLCLYGRRYKQRLDTAARW